MMPLEYMWGCIGIGRSDSLTKTTSGGSSVLSANVLVRRVTYEVGLVVHTDWVLGGKLKPQPVRLVHVKWVLVEHSYIQLPFLEIVGGDEVDARRQAVVDLSRIVLVGQISSLLARCAYQGRAQTNLSQLLRQTF
jgi:hypothetical protein